MTDPGTLLVASLALGTALAAVVAHVPWPRKLDAARVFKAALQLRAPAELAPWHPLAAFPEQKVALPVAWLPSNDALPGELEHVRSLVSLPMEERWVALHRGVSPRPFPPTEDPAVWLGATWEALVAGADTQEPHRQWVVFRDEPSLAPALDFQALDAVDVAWTDGPLEARLSAVFDILDTRAQDPAKRFVLVGEGRAIHLLLRALAAEDGLRDRVEAVISAGGAIHGCEEDGPFGVTEVADWLEHWFQHNRLDTEAFAPIPYVAFQWVAAAAPEPGLVGLPMRRARFPTSRPPNRIHQAIDAHDLGPVDVRCPPDAVVAALRVVVAALAVRVP